VEVKAAKTGWVEKLVKGINDQSTGQGGSAECWQLVKKLRAGLERSVSRKTTMMRRSPTDKLLPRHTVESLDQVEQQCPCPPSWQFGSGL
jgi:hypothetical protein